MGAAPGVANAQTTAPTTAANANNVPLPLSRDILVSGATVATPGQPLRTMNAAQALAFMQAWYPYSLYNKVPNHRPPAILPVSEIHLTTVWQGRTWPLVILYARSGNISWVGMPRQGFGWSFVEKLNWIRAPQGLIPAFEGKVAPIIATDPSTTSPTTTGTAAAAPGGGSDSHTGLWAALVAAVVVLLAGGFALVRRSRRVAT